MPFLFREEHVVPKRKKLQFCSINQAALNGRSITKLSSILERGNTKNTVENHKRIQYTIFRSYRGNDTLEKAFAVRFDRPPGMWASPELAHM
ncbi:hypothetical protein EVAR_10183_1 [Eumeta japonica]|uniref:Uncharacterized protein n=1 Tax=Eumeta variegata TaxID=151549 RepID=A0A4C1TE65_EUMVA|nr:hypothetical protein EVAR_10183_1 [Eumeta japonica]